MEEPVFKAYFDVLDKAGDRARSVLYVFITLNIALFIYGVNSFAYPVRQYIFDEVNLQARCRYRTNNDNCKSVTPALARLAKDPMLNEEIERDFWNHQLDLFYDSSVAMRTFKAPILGLESDRDLLWLIFPLIGVVGYFITISALLPVVTMFRFLLDGNKAVATRLRLMQSVAVISAPLNIARDGEMTRLYQLVWRLITLIVFAIPLLVNVLMIADQTNFVASVIYQQEDQYFLRHPGFFSLAKLAFEIATLALQYRLFRKLVKLGVSFGEDQRHAQGLIAQLETPPKTS
jgi:hypothetical protein